MWHLSGGSCGNDVSVAGGRLRTRELGSLPRGTFCNLGVVGFAVAAAVGVGWLWGLGRQLVFSF